MRWVDEVGGCVRWVDEVGGWGGWMRWVAVVGSSPHQSTRCGA